MQNTANKLFSDYPQVVVVVRHKLYPTQRTTHCIPWLCWLVVQAKVVKCV